MRDRLRQQLAPFERRLRLLEAGRWAARGALLSIGLAILWVLTARWFRLPYDFPIAAAAVGAGALGAFIARLTRRIPMEDVARAADRAAGTSDRFSSAWELADSEWAPLLEKDVLNRPLEAPRRLFPARSPRALRFPGLTLALLIAILYLVPSRPAPLAGPKTTDLEGVNPPPELAQAAEELRRLGALDDRPEWAQLGRELEAIERDWKEGKIDRREALARVGDVRNRIREERERIAAAKEALAKLADGEATHEMAHATATGEGEEAAREAAAALGESAERDAALAAGLERIARGAAADPELREALERAAAAVRRGDRVAFEQAMQQARGRWKPVTRKGKETAAREKRAEKAKTAEQKAKEALKKLDPETARKIAEALKNADLEKLRKAMEEAGKQGKEGKPGQEKELTDEELVEMAKKLAEMLDKETLESLVEKLKKDCAGGS